MHYAADEEAMLQRDFRGFCIYLFCSQAPPNNA
jgi:hypothetical protein